MKVYLLTISKKGKSEMRSLAICKQLNKPISFHVRTKKISLSFTIPVKQRFFHLHRRKLFNLMPL